MGFSVNLFPSFQSFVISANSYPHSLIAPAYLLVSILLQSTASMEKLRQELSDAKADFGASESALAAARIEIEELQSGNADIDSEAEQEKSNLEAELTSSRNEAKRLAEELQQFKDKVFAAKDELEAQTKAKISSLEDDLSVAQDGCLRAEREVEEYKAEMQQYEQQLSSQKQQLTTEKELLASKLREEAAALRIALTDKDAEIHEAKEDLRRDHERTVSKLRERLADVETERDEVITQAASAGREDTEARAEIKKLQKEVKKKDQRIQKLEDVKLTKEQVVALKKMKEERLQYLQERDELKAQLEGLHSADKENVGASTRSTRSSSAAEATTLRQEKEALETKLRKYAKHCQSLEESQQEIADTIKGLSDSEIIEGVDDDLAGAVIALTDKLRISEEEIDALVSEQKRSSNYLMELDRLKEDKASLERSLKKLQNDGSRVGELQEQVDDLMQERSELQELAKSARENSSALGQEQQKQIRYLEQENLNLHLELKQAKQDLSTSRAEANNVAMSTLR